MPPGHRLFPTNIGIALAVLIVGAGIIFLINARHGVSEQPAAHPLRAAIVDPVIPNDTFDHLRLSRIVVRADSLLKCAIRNDTGFTIKDVTLLNRSESEWCRECRTPFLRALVAGFPAFEKITAVHQLWKAGEKCEANELTSEWLSPDNFPRGESQSGVYITGFTLVTPRMEYVVERPGRITGRKPRSPVLSMPLAAGRSAQ